MTPPSQRGWKRRMLTILLPPLVFYLLICAAVFLYQRRMLYFPMPASTPPPVACAETELQIDGPDGPIQAWLLKPELLGTAPVVIYCGGNAEDAALARPAFQNRPWPTVCWNYPGYGDSAGRPSETTIIAAGLALLDHLDERYGDQRRIHMGRSLGAAVAVALAEKRPPTALVLISPSASLSDVAAGQYPMLPARLLLLDSWRSAERAPACPALLIAGETDRAIPPRHSRKLAETWPAAAAFHILPGYGHNDVHFHPDYWSLIERFVAAQD